MKLNDLSIAYNEGKINKRIFWQLVREKTSVLQDISKLIKNTGCQKKVTISANGVVLENNGIKYYMDLSQTISRAEADLAMGGDYEQEDFDYIIDNIHDGDNILDIGGNAGIFSLNIAKNDVNCNIYSFEPLPSTYEKMQANFKLNPALSEKIKSFNVGMSNTIGKTIFYLPGASEAASMRDIDDEYYKVKSDENGQWGTVEESQQIECTIDTVDNFCMNNDISKVDVLKCDVEGAELFVLQGAKETLIKDKPLVYCEMLRKHAKRFGYHPNDIIRYMSDLGYKCFTFRNKMLIEIKNINNETVETNFFFLFGGK